MNIEIKIDKKIKENKIIVQVNEMTDEISNIINLLKSTNNEKLKVYLDEELYFIDENDIETVYSSDGKVFVKANDKDYQSKMRLYELENILNKKTFLRISKSEIININKVKSINTNLIGTIIITFFNGNKTYSSRRYISKIKEFLGI